MLANKAIVIRKWLYPTSSLHDLHIQRKHVVWETGIINTVQVHFQTTFYDKQSSAFFPSQLLFIHIHNNEKKRNASCCSNLLKLLYQQMAFYQSTFRYLDPSNKDALSLHFCTFCKRNWWHVEYDKTIIL